MIDAWFSQGFAPYFSLLSLLALCGWFQVWAQRGRHRAAVTIFSIGIIVIGAGLLAASLIGRTLGQPAYVVRTLALSGGLITLLFSGLLREIRKAYSEADLRKAMARDL